MALKKEKTASGGEIGEVAKQPSFKDRHLKTKKQKLVIAVLTCVVLAFSCLFVMYVLSSKNSDISKNDICSNNSQIKQRATDYIDSNNIDELNKLVSEINAMEDSQKDPTCVAILIWQDIIYSNDVKARERLSDLSNVYNDNSVVVESQGHIFTNNPDTISKRIAELEQRIKIQNKNRANFNYDPKTVIE